MDTQQAIDTLIALKATIDSNAAGLSAQSDALGISISQLQGTLETQIADKDQEIAAAVATQADTDEKYKEVAVAQAIAEQAAQSAQVDQPAQQEVTS